jgi:hypothetical protein
VPVKQRKAARQVVVISDTHCASTLGLCHPDGHHLDDGGSYQPSKAQKAVWNIWQDFWGEWVPRVTKREPWDLVINGDALDGDHHRTSTIISPNLQDQHEAAVKCLEPVVCLCLDSGGRYYHIRGTEAHVGQSGQNEERLAKALGATPDEEGNSARWDMWKRVEGALCHFTHHIGTTSSVAYESTAVRAEWAEMQAACAEAGVEPPQVVVRSHRHRHFEIRTSFREGYGISTVTPAWQLKTPFTFRTSGRRSQPQFGGIVIRAGDEELHTRFYVRRIERSRVEE